MRASTLLLLISALCLAIGCGKDGASGKPAADATGQTAGPDSHAGHDHHDHDHAALGPHGGHVMEIGEEQYHAEWTHDNTSGKITIYLLDGEIKDDAWSTAESIVISTTIRDKTEDYQLVAANQDDQNPPQASKFEITSPNLLTALNQVGEAVKAELKVSIGGDSFTKAFEAHNHDH